MGQQLRLVDCSNGPLDQTWARNEPKQHLLPGRAISQGPGRSWRLGRWPMRGPRRKTETVITNPEEFRVRMQTLREVKQRAE